MICEDHSSPSYYCDEVDLCWLEAVNKHKKLKGLLEALQNLRLEYFSHLTTCYY